MLKKLRKTLTKEIKNRYDKMESRYLGLENRIYTTIEDRLTLLESKFDDLSELIKDEVRFRKERNEDKLEDRDQEEDNETPFSDKVEEVKEMIDEKVKEAKEVVTEKVEEAKNIVTSKLKKGKKAKAKAEKKVKDAAKKVKKVVKKIEDNDLTAIKGLGEKMSEKLKAEGIISFQQLAEMTEKDIEVLDEKIKSFAARFKRYEWGKQAKEQ